MNHLKKLSPLKYILAVMLLFFCGAKSFAQTAYQWTSGPNGTTVGLKQFEPTTNPITGAADHTWIVSFRDVKTGTGEPFKIYDKEAAGLITGLNNNPTMQRVPYNAGDIFEAPGVVTGYVAPATSPSASGTSGGSGTSGTSGGSSTSGTSGGSGTGSSSSPTDSQLLYFNGPGGGIYDLNNFGPSYGSIGTFTFLGYE